jgi:biotin transport system substrate-specific component
MNAGHTTTVSTAQSWTMPRVLRHVLKVALGTAFVAVCAHIALPLPFSPVPLTLQTFAVLLIGLTYSPQIASQTMFLYLAEGLFRMPVFAPTGLYGAAHLIGPTGGYLLSFPTMAVLAAFLVRKLQLRLPRMAAALVACTAASLFNLAAGTLWLGLVLRSATPHLLWMGLLPFLPGEAVKAAAATGISGAWTSLRRKF